QVTIREYESTDFSIVKKLILEADNFGEPFLETELLNIRKNTSPGLGKVFVATTKDQVIGYISLDRRIFALMVDSIIVDRDYQRKGVGRKLVEKAKDFAESQGFHVLRTDTATFMGYAIRFYLACGFVPCGYVEHDFGLGSKQLHFYMELKKEEKPNSI
ncbi:MAG: GNAT family N-acetyltransferase, partial [Candidatus Bathyarchaeota archaeon]